MKKILKIIIFIVVYILSSFNVVFANNNISQQKEIIFLIDSSNSMNSFDSQNLVLDEIKKISNFLTSEYKVGVVVYNTNVVDYAYVNNDLAYLNSILDRTKYAGFTNAGDALDFAINMFSENSIYKNIIMVSDGEIVLKNEKLTNQSSEKFKQAINIAKQKNIIIDTIALGELSEDGKKYNILDASQLTGGNIFKCDNILKLNKVSNEILFNKFNIKKSVIGVGNASNGELNINLPTTNVDKVKVLIASNDTINNINVNCKSEAANVINGKNFAIVEIINPYEQNINLKFNSKGKLEAYLLQEYIVNISGEIIDYYYENNTVKATLNIYLKNEKGNIFNNNYYENKNLNLNINDEVYESIIKDGKATIILDTLKFKQDLNISLNLKEFEQNFLNLSNLNLKLDNIKINELLEQNKKDYKFLPLYIILVILVFIILIIIIKNIDNKKKDKIRQQELKKEREKSLFKSKNPYIYSGKLNIYIINTKDGEDIPPQTFNLQRKETSEKITLKEILNACKLKIGDASSRNIVFEPAGNKALNITNNSYSTIIRNGSLVTFEKSVNINFNEKISVILEDEVTELEIHYKSLKPSEINSYI